MKNTPKLYNNLLKIKGFALLDAFLAVILLSIAAYGSFAFINYYSNESEAQSVIQKAISITENYQPFLENSYLSTGDTSIFSSKNQLSVDFFHTSGIKDADLVTPTDTYSYVYTGSSVGGKRGQMGFSAGPYQDSSSSSHNYFVIGFSASCQLLTSLLQDANTSFSIFAKAGTYISLSNATLQTSLPTCSSSNPTYTVFLVTPNIGINPSPGQYINFTPPAAS